MPGFFVCQREHPLRYTANHHPYRNKFMKRPIDRIRNSALSMEIGEPGESNSISEMFKISDKLHVVTGSAIYQIKFADEIDPDRTNIAVPNTQQKVIHYGSNSSFVGNTLLTAQQLFGEGSPHFEIGRDAIQLSFEHLKDLVAMLDIAQAFAERDNIIELQIIEMKTLNLSLLLPSTPNLKGRARNLFKRPIMRFNLSSQFLSCSTAPI